ncbi:MAG TPA: hypothetical protein VNE58_06705 [Casimicrobiaceae bacterium]|nr:hypothetical protein [Casimicrobiaceae bacterium]
MWPHPAIAPFVVAPFVWEAWRLTRLRSAALIAKSGLDIPTLDTLVGAAHWWLVTGSPWILLAAIALIVIGARSVLARFPEAVTGSIGVVLTVIGILSP